MSAPAPKAQVHDAPRGTTLVSRNVSVDGHRTSVRLEPLMWEALGEICLREQASASALVTEIARDRVASTLTAAIRVYLLAYFRAAAIEEGHLAAGHGGIPRRQRA
jgi:predicted DNA-binding ribbon-helix-helix protein